MIDDNDGSGHPGGGGHRENWVIVRDKEVSLLI